MMRTLAAVLAGIVLAIAVESGATETTSPSADALPPVAPAVAKVGNVAGTPDTSWGPLGKRVVPFNGRSNPRAIAIQPDQKLLVGDSAGSTIRVLQSALPDTSYGLFGVVKLDIVSGGCGAVMFEPSLFIQTDGQLLIGCSTSNGGSARAGRFTPSGQPSLPFGTNGVVTTRMAAGTTLGHAITAQADGKVLLAGRVANAEGRTDMLLLRYNVDGTLDPAFGNGGAALASLPGIHLSAQAVAVRPDGKIIVGGNSSADNSTDAKMAFARFAADGTLEQLVRIVPNGTNNAWLWAMAMRPDGRVVAVGELVDAIKPDFSAYVRAAVIQVSPDGLLEFSAGLPHIGVFKDVARGVALQPDGKIVVVGQAYANDAFLSSFLVMRLHANGILDDTFGTGGIVTQNFTPQTDSAYGVVIQADGAIMVVGDTQTEGILVRYLGDPPNLLTVTRAGAGSGTVASAPGAINCGTTCAAGFFPGLSTTLTATAALGSTFAGWTGCDSVNGNQCTVTMSTSKDVTASFSLGQAGTAPAITSGSAASFTVTQPGSFTVTATGTPAPTLSVTGTLPSGVTFNPATGALSGTPSLGTVGTHTITFKAANGVIPDATQAFTLTVNRAPQTITFNNPGPRRLSDPPPSPTASSTSGLTVTIDTLTPQVCLFAFGSFTLRGAGDCTLVASQVGSLNFLPATSVTRTFNVSAQVDVTKSGNGSGTVASAPAGIDCGATCSADFAGASTVVLAATPAAGSTFGAWTGCDTANGTQCTVLVNAARAVTASFNVGPPPTPFVLSVTRQFSGAGNGSVTSSPVGIDCGTTCSAAFNAGTSVTLTATPTAGSTFNGWTGCDTVNGTQCTVAMNAARNATATFGTVAKTLSVSPGSIAFGLQSMGTTSPTRHVTLTNTGTATVTISSVAISGAGFAQIHDCSSLAVGAHCTIDVAFTPPNANVALNGTVPASGTVTITSDATGSPASVALTGSGEKALVSHYYRSILGRDPDAGGQAFWASQAAQVTQLGLNVNEVWFAMAMSFYTSPEYVAFARDNAGFVSDLYDTFFNRPADAGGLGFWVGQIAQGMPREVVLAGFMFSPEFVTFTGAIFGNTAVRPEIDAVTDFYRGILSRLPDDAGFLSWRGAFRAAQCNGPAAVVAQVEAISSAFVTSGEYTLRQRTNAQFVGDMYNAFLRRGGDLVGVQYWLNALDTNASTREQVRQGFIASAEFQARVQAIAAAPCIP